MSEKEDMARAEGVKCASRVDGSWLSRREDLETYMDDSDVYDNGNEDLPPFNEYGLAFDYVTPGTFKDQQRGYWRFQISYGGPSEEIRYWGDCIDDYRCTCDRAEFWLLDWWDGASVDVTRDEVARWAWEQFVETGTASHQYREAMKDWEPEQEADDDDDDD